MTLYDLDFNCFFKFFFFYVLWYKLPERPRFLMMAPSICGAKLSVLFCRTGAAEVAGVLGAYDQKLRRFEILVFISCRPLLKDICGVSHPASQAHTLCRAGNC